MTRLLLWRHGQTAWNLERRWQGQINTELDETGLAQAAESAPRVAAYRPDLIVSSDLLRASRTAEELTRLVDRAPDFDPRLRERDFGPWQGLTTPEIQRRYPEYVERPGGLSLVDHPEVESHDDLIKRVSLAVADAVERVGAGTVVLVTHGGSARVAMGTLLGWPREVWPTVSGLRNCGICELRRTDRWGWQLAAFNV